MNISWLVTPYFFDEHHSCLAGAVPESVSFTLNDPGGRMDRSPQSLARAHRPIAGFVHAAAAENYLPVSIAGDCAASLPVMADLQRAGLEPVLVWLDAHGDFNTPETSPSGFLGGMPLAMMVGRGDLSIPESTGQRPVSEQDVWLIGARDLDPLEAPALASSRVNRLEIAGLETLEFNRPVHLHIDNDVIDAADVPANNYPVACGPRLETVIEKCTAFAARNTLCAVSFSGWNGNLDRNGQTGQSCRALLTSILNSA